MALRLSHRILGWRGFFRILGALGACAFLEGPCRAGGLSPTDLRTEYQVDPNAVDSARPRFSWVLEPVQAAARQLSQTAYEVRVSSAPGPASEARLVWDSGEVPSGQSRVSYAGAALEPNVAYNWVVRARDQASAWSDWSAPAAFRTGLREKGDWTASWIGTGENESADAQENVLLDPWFRRGVDLEEVPARAIAHVASVGFQELYVNGRKVGDAVLMPSVTDNGQRARYVTYDITDRLHRGHNVLGLWLGTGWSIYPAFATADKPRAPIAMAQIDLVMKDGSTRRVVSDSSWKSHPSPNRLLGSWFFMKYGGESFDANRELPGWASPGQSDAGWTPAVVFNPHLEVTAETAEPNRPIEAISAQGLEEPSRGVYRFDMGRNFSGWVEARISGNPGDRIDFKISERPGEAMTYGLHSSYVIGSTGRGVFSNHFNYCAGRWITIRGLRSRPALDSVRGWLVRTAYSRASAFECSEANLNQIYDTTLWTLENLSLGGYLVDCPHRERMGYGGDAHATTVTALMNFRTEAFFTKWSQDWRDVQYQKRDTPDPRLLPVAFGTHEPGDVPYTAPTYWGGGGPAWSGYCVDLPWEFYRHTGDLQMLQTNFATIERWIGYLETKSSGNLLHRWGGDWDFLGDWLWPGAKGINNGTQDTLFFNNCYWAYELSTAAEIARLVGKGERAAQWSARANQVRSAINQALYRPDQGGYVAHTQTYLAMALLADVPPASDRGVVWRQLEDQILVVRKGHIDAGITGGAMLFKLLIEAHRNDLIYSMVSQTSYPGWVDLLKRGETTFGESWDGKDSLLHSSYLYAGGWFISGVLGIQPGPDGQGFKRFSVYPGPVDQPALTWAKGHFDSPQGRISVEWSRKGSMVSLEVAVPANTTASVFLPSTRPAMIMVDGQPLSGAQGVVSWEVRGDRTAVNVGSGSYHFEAHP